MTTLLPLKRIVLNIDKATTQLQMFLKPTTQVLTPQGLDVFASGICLVDGWKMQVQNMHSSEKNYMHKIITVTEEE